MPTPITMPALSPTMTEGTLAKWLKKEGDTVESGDVIAEIETDKATMEVEAVDEGRIAKILIAEGTENVPVNDVIAVLLEEGEDDSAMDGYEAKGGVAPAAAAPEAADKAKPAAPAKSEAPAPKSETTKSGERVFASPLAKRLAEQAGIDLSAIKGTGLAAALSKPMSRKPRKRA